MSKGFTHEPAHSGVVEWYTPDWIFKRLNLEFDLDPASPGSEIVPWIPARTHYTIKDNGLRREWFGRVWLNPPYGRFMEQWIAKFIEHHNGIALVFSRTDSRWFHDYAVRAAMICFMRGRLKFVPGIGNNSRTNNSAGAGSLLLACGYDCWQALVDSDLGFCIEPAISRVVARQAQTKLKLEGA